MSIETFKPAFAGWLAYRELGDFAKVWHDKPLQEDAPSWAAAALYIEEGGLSGVFNLGDTEMWTEFENLLTKHKVWWEMEDSCWIWLYPEGTFDGVGK